MIKNKRRNSSIVRTPPPPSNQQKKPGMLSTLGESMIWGTGIGFGSEAGHSIFRGIFGNNTNQHPNNQQYKVQTRSACEEMTILYEKCLLSNSFEQDKCNFLKEDMSKFCKI